MIDTYHGIWIKPYKGDCYFSEHPAFYLRKSFTAPAALTKAEIQLCGLGVHELFVNGKPASDRWYAPGLSQFDYRVGSITYDVRDLLIPGGENVIMVHLGNGFYNCRNSWKYTVNFSSWRAAPRLICDVLINGEVAAVSGADWKIHQSPVIYDCHHTGEDYDARLELPEAAFLPGFDDSAWENTSRALPPGGILEHDIDEPCRVIARYPGKLISAPDAGYKIFDFGVNFSGVAEVKMRGPAGCKATFRYGEMLDGSGRVNTDNVSMNVPRFDTDTYIFKGEGTEIWHPHFVWHGFQYIEVTFEDGEGEIEEITGLFISSDLKKRGSFECSDPQINRLQEITMVSYRSNFMSIPTDCPTREKFGWTGDADHALETGMWNFAPENGLRRLVDITMDIQRPDGNFTTHGPTTLWGFEQACPSYSVFMYSYCRYCWEFNGDDEPMKKYYDQLKLGAKFFEVLTADDHLCHFGYADWCHPVYHPYKHDPTPTESFSWYTIVQDMILFAGHLGKDADRKHYEELLEKIGRSIIKTFYDPDKQVLDDGFWAANAMALCLGLFSGDEKAAVARNLAESVRAEGHRVLAGTLGARFIPRALAKNGYAEDAYLMLTQKEYPGWGNIIAQGATSLWETWDGKTSMNHIMFGDVSAWMYRYLAGLSPAAPGFARVNIKPALIDSLNWVKAEYETVKGKILISWEKTSAEVKCHVELPAGVTAVIQLPGVEKEITGTADLTASL